MDQRLRVMSGPDKGLSFQLPEAGSQTLGRSRQHNEMCLHDPAVARVHCQVETEQGVAIVSDFDSDTGTFVNGAPVTRHELKHGDVIRIGETELQFESIGGGALAAAPEPAATAARHPATPGTNRREELAALAGTSLGHFELGTLLGKGQAGAVFRARDRKDERTVALKVLHADFPKSDEEMMQFGQALKGMLPHRHPNLVTIFGAGKSSHHCWISMEYVEGESLAQMLQWIGTAGLPDWQQAFRLAVHLGRALFFAHQHHLVHRNITPPNILFRSIDKQIKLSDLVLTPALAGSSLRLSGLRDKFLGELAYLAPEQTQPRADPDIRSDIYSAGAVVYSLLTGSPPFAGKSAAETIRVIREMPPGAPRRLQPGLPDAFESTVLKMLAKRPEDRQQTPAELLAQLARVAPEPI